jgi:hypothetical protein
MTGHDDLPSRLRAMRFREPRPELREKVLQGAARALAPLPRQSWWPELALVATLLLLFLLSPDALTTESFSAPSGRDDREALIKAFDLEPDLAAIVRSQPRPTKKPVDSDDHWLVFNIESLQGVS